MDVRGYVDENAAGFFGALRQWLAIPSISGDPAHRADVRRSAVWLGEDQVGGPARRPALGQRGQRLFEISQRDPAGLAGHRLAGRLASDGTTTWCPARDSSSATGRQLPGPRLGEWTPAMTGATVPMLMPR